MFDPLSLILLLEIIDIRCSQEFKEYNINIYTLMHACYTKTQDSVGVLKF